MKRCLFVSMSLGAAEMVIGIGNGMPGMSGGPILYRGRVVSIITGGGPANAPSQLIGTGVTWASLSAFLRQHVQQ